MSFEWKTFVFVVFLWLGVAGTGWCFYNPSTGRWLSRDPFEEFGGLNIQGFVFNRPTVYMDSDGRFVVESLAIGTAVGTEVGTTAGTTSSAITYTFTTSSGTAAGTLPIGPVILAGAGGAAIGRILDYATGGALSDVYAGTFGYATDWYYHIGPQASASSWRQGQSSIEQQQEAERLAYHKRCDEPYPPNLTGCDLLYWLLRRVEDCIRMRQDYIDKWGDTYQGHEDQIEQRKQERQNLLDRIRRECQPCPSK